MSDMKLPDSGLFSSFDNLWGSEREVTEDLKTALKHYGTLVSKKAEVTEKLQSEHGLNSFGDVSARSAEAQDLPKKVHGDKVSLGTSEVDVWVPPVTTSHFVQATHSSHIDKYSGAGLSGNIDKYSGQFIYGSSAAEGHWETTQVAAGYWTTRTEEVWGEKPLNEAQKALQEKADLFYSKYPNLDVAIKLCDGFQVEAKQEVVVIDAWLVELSDDLLDVSTEIRQRIYSKIKEAGFEEHYEKKTGDIIPD